MRRRCGGVVRDQANTKVVLSEVREFDVAGRRVSVAGPNGASMELPYGILAAAGATHGYFGHDEWAAYAPGMKTLEDARHRAITSWVPSNWLS